MMKRNFNFLLTVFYIGILSAAAFAAAPANDNFINAENITDPQRTFSRHYTGTNVDATVEPGEPSQVGMAPHGTVWYKWIPDVSKGVQISLRRSTFDTVISVYTGTALNNLDLVAESDNISSNNFKSSVSFFAVNNTTYYIAVGRGQFTIDGGTVGIDIAPALTRTSPDFDGDGATDFAVYRPSDNTYYVGTSASGNWFSRKWGSPGDIVVPANMTQEQQISKTDLAVFRPSTGDWHMLSLDTPSFVMNSVHFGQAGDIPITGNFVGTVNPDLGVYRPSNNTWYFESMSGQFFTAVKFGELGDIPVPADYNKDGVSDIAVFRPSNGTWYIRYTNGTDTSVQWGMAGDIPLRGGDYDADGVNDIAVFRPSDGNWYILGSRFGSMIALHWGQAGDIPVVGDFTGDGYSDYAVFRPSTGYWHLNFNQNEYPPISLKWGMDGDIPLGGMTLQ